LDNTNLEDQQDTPPRSPVSNNSSPEQKFKDKPSAVDAAEHELGQPTPLRSNSMIPAGSISSNSSPQGKIPERGDYMSHDRRTTEQRPMGIERTESAASNSSVVAAMRNRYSYTVSLSQFAILFETNGP
jgi:hypothetical protein